MGRLDGRLICERCCKELVTVETGVAVKFGGHGVFMADIRACQNGCTRIITGWSENPVSGSLPKIDYEVR